MSVVRVESAVLFSILLFGRALQLVRLFQQILNFCSGHNLLDWSGQWSEGHRDLILATPLLV